MSPRVGSAAGVSVLFWASLVLAQPVINYKSHELLDGRNYVQDFTAVLAVGEASGDVSYRYDIDLPASRGATPSLALEYSSHGSQSEYGWGWELTIPVVERSDRTGVPIFNNNPFRQIYRYREGHTTHELVAAGTAPAGWQAFRELDDSTFSRYYLNTTENRWVILRPDGTRLKLGDGNAKRGYDPASGFTATNTWLADRIEDSRGNYTAYTYQADPWAIAPTWNSRISSIAYNGNSISGQSANLSVSFIWATHWGNKPPIPVSYRPGYRREFGQDHLASIVVSAPQHGATGPATVPANSPTSRTYTLGYPPTQGVSHDNIFYLSSVQLESTPPVTFTYSNPSANTTVDSQFVFGPADPATGTDFPNDIGVTKVTINGDGSTTLRTLRVLADINSDGRQDILDVSSGNGVAWINNGTAFTRETWSMPTAAGLDSNALKVVRSLANESDTVQDFTDLNGDGYPDLVYFTATSPILIEYCPGTGSGFGACISYGGTPTGAGFLRRDEVGFGVTVTDVDLIDIDGDGRADSVRSDPSGTMRVYRNLGIEFENSQSNGSYSLALPPCATAYYGLYPACLREYAQTSGSPNRILLAELRDINGDGIPDFVEVNNSSPAAVAIALGSGMDFQFLPNDSSRPTDIGTGYQSSAGDYVELSSLADLNGDGLADYISADCRVGTSYAVRFNIGGYFDLAGYTHAFTSNPSGYDFEYPCTNRVIARTAQDGSTLLATTAALTDMNGDGLPDIVSAELDPFPIPPNTTYLLLVRQIGYIAPRKMTDASSLAGNHQMSVIYAAQNGDAPYPIHAPVLISTTRTPLYPTEPTRNTSVTTQYTYSPPRFRRSDLMFAGFGTVIATGDTFSNTQTTSYTTADVTRQAGLVIAQQTLNNVAQGAYTNIVNYYSTTEAPIGHYVTRRTRGEVYIGGGRDVATDYTAQDDYGSVTQWTERGDPGTADDIEHTLSFVTRDSNTPGDFLLHLPSVEGASSSGGGAAPTVRSYYDDPVNLGATPIAGELVKVEHERDLGVYVARQFSYDSSGNLATETDETGNVSSYSYDPTYSLFRISITTSIGTVYRSYHALTGHVATTCGPQSDGSSPPTWNCRQHQEDSLGRTTAEYVPLLVSGHYTLSLLTSVSYDDQSYPLSMTMVTRGTQHSVEYRDGFGNPTEVRIEETPNTYRVFETAFDGWGRALRVELAHRETGASYTHAPISAEAWVYTNDYVHGSIETVTYPRDPGDNSAPAVATRVVNSNGVAMIDEDGRETDYYVDGLGRVSRTVRLGGILGAATTYFTRSTRGDITQVMDPNGLMTTYTRKLCGWPASVTMSVGGGYSYTYYDNGQVATSVDPRGVLVTYSYDFAGRISNVVSANEPTGVRHINFGYNYYNAAASPRGQTALWAQNNGLLREEDTDPKTSSQLSKIYTYTPEGAVATERVTYGAFGGTVSFGYDSGRRLNSVTYPDGVVAQYSHNLDDSVQAITGTLGYVGSLGSYYYDDGGHPNLITNSGGLSESFTYDARGRMVDVLSENTNSGLAPLVDDRWRLTKGSLLMELDRYGLAPGAVPRQTPDIYMVTNDALGRLWHVELNGATFAQYTYDIGDRLTGINEDGGAVGTATFNHDELLTRTAGPNSSTWSYDAAGNVIHDEQLANGQVTRARDHSWDGLGRYEKSSIVGGATTEYFYSPSGELVRVLQPGELQTTDDVLQVGAFARLNMVSGAWTDRVIANGEAIGELKSTGFVFEFPHHTLAHSVAAVSNSAGQIIRQEEFKPYGARLAGAPGGTFEEHFHGIRADELIVTGHRAYDADGGIWLSRDLTIVGDPTKVADAPALANLYSFNFSNPYGYRDSNSDSPVLWVVEYNDGLPIGVHRAADQQFDMGGPAVLQNLYVEHDTGVSTVTGSVYSEPGLEDANWVLAAAGAGTATYLYGPKALIAILTAYGYASAKTEGQAGCAASCSYLPELKLGPRVITRSTGETLDVSKVTIPGPRQSQWGKIDYLLGNVKTGANAAKSAGKGGFFRDVLGFSENNLGAALKQHLVEHWNTAKIAGSKIRAVGKILGPNGKTANLLTVWQVREGGAVELVTAQPGPK